MWDVFKEPAEESFQGISLLSYFTELERGHVRLGVGGKTVSAADVRACLDAGVDFVVIGRAAILHHDFPLRVNGDANFRAAELPATPEFLCGQGSGKEFIRYMSTWRRFVENPGQQVAPGPPGVAGPSVSAGFNVVCHKALAVAIRNSRVPSRRIPGTDDTGPWRTFDGGATASRSGEKTTRSREDHDSGSFCGCVSCRRSS